MSGDPTRVAFVHGTTAGGTGTHVRTLAAGLAARGIQVSIFGPAAAGEPPGPPLTFTAVEIADRPRPVRDIAAVARLRRLLRKRAPAVVHAHGLRAGALTALALRPMSLAGIRARCSASPGGHRIFRGHPGPRRPGTPRPGKRAVFLVTVHNAPPASGGMAAAIYAILERIVARAADRVLCVSGDLAGRMRRRGARSVGPAVVPAPALPAVDAAAQGDAPPMAPRAPDSVQAALGAAGRPLVLAAGRLAPQKGFSTLLDAAALLRGHKARPLVVIAGDGPLRAQLTGRIDTERLPLRCLGQRDDVPALLGAADLFVLPSLWEGQPLILQEALRAGAAIVATRTGGIPEITGEDAALLVPPADPERLAAAISRVLEEPDLAARLRAAAAERARSLPGEDEAVDAVLADYRLAALRLLPGGGAGDHGDDP